MRRISTRAVLAFSTVLGLAGITAPSVAKVSAATETIQILATNDFHGRINPNAQSAEAGAAVLAGAVKQLEAQHPTVFAAAGDLIGASTFESYILKDKPTIDALNEAGLDVSAAGNHEFDAGYDDLLNRVMAPFDATSNPYGGANWQYLAANVRKTADGSPALATGANNGESWITTLGTTKVGFIGAVTEHLDELVSPDGIKDLTITNIVTESNRIAADLRAAGAQVVVLLVHEGAATTDIASATDPASDFGKIVNGASADIDAIVSGHTHLAYNHSIPIAGTSRSRPVVSAGQYGMKLNRLLFTIDGGTITSVATDIIDLAPGGVAAFPVDAATDAIVKQANADADPLGKVELGKIAGAQKRSTAVDPKDATKRVENRGGESTLGNLIAEVQRWATSSATFGSAQIAFMNPGGLRADLTGTGTYPSPVTYKQAATVQPFANTLVNMTMTGAQIRQALEQQWQPAGASRPVLRLGISKGFTYTYDPAATAGTRIKEMWLNGAPILADADYSVTVNSFLAAGGDNFAAFAAGAGKRDTGQIDLQSFVDYMAQFKSTPLPVDYSQRSVGISYPAAAPASYKPGDRVVFTLSSLAMAATGSAVDTSVSVFSGSVFLGVFPVDNTVGTDLKDEYGTAQVEFTLPSTLGPSPTLTIVGNTTGTQTSVVLRSTGSVLPPLGMTVIRGEPNTTGVISIVATETQAPGFLQVLPCADVPATTSNVNYDAAWRTVSGLATARFDRFGVACVFNYTSTHLVVDLQGYFTPGSYDDTADVRLVDTRLNNGARPAADSQTQIRGLANRTAVVSLVATENTAAGFLQVLACGAKTGATSNVNYTEPFSTRSGLALVRFGADGTACIANVVGATHVVADLQGYLVEGAVTDVDPDERILDTRKTSKPASGSMTEIRGEPNRTAVVGLVAAETAEPGFLQVLDCGATPQRTSNLNFDRANAVESGLAMVRFNADGKACIYNYGSTQIIADVQGYLAPDAFDDIVDERLVDTRLA